jgi:hypothetical protein
MLKQFQVYIFTNYKILEWVFTLRLLLIGSLLFFIGLPINRFIGVICLLIGLCGLIISQSWVRNLANVSFVVSIFSLSVILESVYLVRQEFDTIMVYTLAGDILISGWLLRRVMLEYFGRHERPGIHHHSS